MLIYNYDKVTREIIRNVDGNVGVEARPDPLQEGSFLLPANSTTVEPPAYAPGYTRCFIDKWVYIEDHRGQTVYNTTTADPKTITSIGTIPVEYTLLAPCEYPLWNGTMWIIDEVAKAKAVAQQNAADAQAAEIAAREAAKLQAILSNLPSWEEVRDSFDNLVTDGETAETVEKLRAVVVNLVKLCRKQARVTYWLARDSET